MKFKMPLILLAALSLYPGCRSQRPALVPEISPPLIQEEVGSWTGRLAGEAIFPLAGGIGWVDASGQVIACDVEKKTTAVAFAVPFPVTARPFLQGDLLVLTDEASDRLLVYDLVADGVKFESCRLGAGQILGVAPGVLVCQDSGRLAVRFWERPSEVFRAPEAEERYFNCHFSPERILVLGRERLYTFWRKSGTFESAPLPQPAASPFFLENENIYYGSSRRDLVKYSVEKKRPLWELKLGQVLARRPFAFAGSIIASPADQNILQVNPSGSLLWWQALRSTMSFDLLPMSENLAAVLLNREIKFIDPRLRQVTVFQGMSRPLGPPLAFRRDLYYMAHDNGQAYRLLRVGNRYGLDIELEPAPVRWVGRSLRFTVQPQHLLEPRLECVIVDAQGRTAFSKDMEGGEKASLVWVPLQPGKYVIRVKARAKNRDAQGEVPVQVLDPLQVVPGFYLHF
jgi:hypothetical protein